MTKDIAKRIREIRKAMGLTQSQFAELVNLSVDSIGKIERGVSLPTIETLRNVAGGLNVQLAELLGEAASKGGAHKGALENLVKYLKTKSNADVKFVHEVAVKILERKTRV